MTNISENIIKKKIMVVVAHPDDEVLGLGASMHRLIHNYQVQTHVVILGEGITSRSEKRNPEKWAKELEMHRDNIHAAQKLIGYQSVSIIDFPDNRFDSVALLDIIKVIEKEKETYKPDIIFTHHGGDLNIDHQRTFEAVITSCRPLESEKVKTIITFETASSTEWQASNSPNPFRPNLFIPISKENLDAKIRAMECYESEKRPYPHPRSPEALKIQVQQWGIVIGCQLAEAFCLVRGIL
jgi:LmbE family N-acetylglucosaminyl deacetylase